MIIFDYNILFSDEWALNDSNIDKSKETITVSESKKCDLSKKFQIRSPWVAMTLRRVRYYSNSRFEVISYGDSWALEIENIVTLLWYGKNKIKYIKGRKYRASLLQFWVFHTFLPLVLELKRKYRVLHMGGVRIGKKAVLFSALSFGGKSTLVDFFLQQGHDIFSDDTLAISRDDKSYHAIASYPFCRPYRKPEILGNFVTQHVCVPTPISAIYTLKKSDPNAEIIISKLRGIEKFKAFHYSSFVNFDFLKIEHFQFFTKLAKSIPTYQITIPWDLERLEEVYQAIIIHNNVNGNMNFTKTITN